jgi:hypothetical protein
MPSAEGLEPYNAIISKFCAAEKKAFNATDTFAA